MSDDETDDRPDDESPRPDVVPTHGLRLVGEIDISEVGLVRRQLLSHIMTTEDPEVVVDLSRVTFMDCAGLEPFLSVDRCLNRRNRRLVLRPVSAQVEFLFASLRQAGLFTPFEDPEGPEPTKDQDLINDVPEDLDLADDLDLVHLIDQVCAVEAARLRRAFEGRPLIDQATGVLMAVHKCAATEALELLTRIARLHNMTAGDLAAGLAGLTAARGGRSTLDLSLDMKAAVRGVLAHPGRSPVAKAGPAP